MKKNNILPSILFLVSCTAFFSFIPVSTTVEVLAYHKGKMKILGSQEKISAKDLPDSLVLKVIAPDKAKYILKYRTLFGEGLAPVINDQEANEFDVAERSATIQSDMLQVVGQSNHYLAFDVWTVYKIDGNKKTVNTDFKRILYKISFTE